MRGDSPNKLVGSGVEIWVYRSMLNTLCQLVFLFSLLFFKFKFIVIDAIPFCVPFTESSEEDGFLQSQ